MANKCSFDPSAPPYDTAALGMFHCPECGEMVLAGVAHPDYSLIESAPNKAWSRLVQGVAKFARKIAEFVIR